MRIVKYLVEECHAQVNKSDASLYETPIAKAQTAGNSDIAQYLERQLIKQQAQPKRIRVSPQVHIKDEQVDVQPAQVRIKDKQIEGVPAQVRIEDKQVSVPPAQVHKQAPVSVRPAQVHIQENPVSVPPAQVQGVVFESMS